MAVITISRQFGIGGTKLARILSDSTGWRFYGNDLANVIAEKMEINTKEILNHEKELIRKSMWEISAFGGRFALFETHPIDEKKYYKVLYETINELAKSENFILLGWGGQCLLKDYPNSYHFRIVADLSSRLKVIRSFYRNPEDIPTNQMLEQILNDRDRQRQQYIRTHFKTNVENPNLYHAIFNLSKLGIERIIDFIIQIVKNDQRITIRQSTTAR